MSKRGTNCTLLQRNVKIRAISVAPAVSALAMSCVLVSSYDCYLQLNQNTIRRKLDSSNCVACEIIGDVHHISAECGRVSKDVKLLAVIQM